MQSSHPYAASSSRNVLPSSSSLVTSSLVRNAAQSRRYPASPSLSPSASVRSSSTYSNVVDPPYQGIGSMRTAQPTGAFSQLSQSFGLHGTTTGSISRLSSIVTRRRSGLTSEPPGSDRAVPSSSYSSGQATSMLPPSNNRPEHNSRSYASRAPARTRSRESSSHLGGRTSKETYLRSSEIVSIRRSQGATRPSPTPPRSFSKSDKEYLDRKLVAVKREPSGDSLLRSESVPRRTLTPATSSAEMLHTVAEMPHPDSQPTIAPHRSPSALRHGAERQRLARSSSISTTTNSRSHPPERSGLNPSRTSGTEHSDRPQTVFEYLNFDASPETGADASDDRLSLLNFGTPVPPAQAPSSFVFPELVSQPATDAASINAPSIPTLDFDFQRNATSSGSDGINHAQVALNTADATAFSSWNLGLATPLPEAFGFTNDLPNLNQLGYTQGSVFSASPAIASFACDTINPAAALPNLPAPARPNASGVRSLLPVPPTSPDSTHTPRPGPSTSGPTQISGGSRRHAATNELPSTPDTPNSRRFEMSSEKSMTQPTQPSSPFTDVSRTPQTNAVSNSDESTPPQKRGRGRPRGSRNRPKSGGTGPSSGGGAGKVLSTATSARGRASGRGQARRRGRGRGAAKLNARTRQVPSSGRPTGQVSDTGVEEGVAATVPKRSADLWTQWKPKSAHAKAMQAAILRTRPEPPILRSTQSGTAAPESTGHTTSSPNVAVPSLSARRLEKRKAVEIPEPWSTNIEVVPPARPSGFDMAVCSPPDSGPSTPKRLKLSAQGPAGSGSTELSRPGQKQTMAAIAATSPSSFTSSDLDIQDWRRHLVSSREAVCEESRSGSRPGTLIADEGGSPPPMAVGRSASTSYERSRASAATSRASGSAVGTSSSTLVALHGLQATRAMSGISQGRPSSSSSSSAATLTTIRQQEVQDQSHFLTFGIGASPADIAQAAIDAVTKMGDRIEPGLRVSVAVNASVAAAIAAAPFHNDLRGYLEQERDQQRDR